MSGASAIGVPGWPDFACWTASIDRVRMQLIDNWSSSASLIGRDKCLLAWAVAVISRLQLAFRLSMIFSENRYPLFGIMRVAEPLGCRAIGEDQGSIPTHAGCRNRSIAVAQTRQRLGLLA